MYTVQWLSPSPQEHCSLLINLAAYKEKLKEPSMSSKGHSPAFLPFGTTTSSCIPCLWTCTFSKQPLLSLILNCLFHFKVTVQLRLLITCNQGQELSSITVISVNPCVIISMKHLSAYLRTSQELIHLLLHIKQAW